MNKYKKKLFRLMKEYGVLCLEALVSFRVNRKVSAMIEATLAYQYYIDILGIIKDVRKSK